MTTQTNQAIQPALEAPFADIEWDVVEGENTEFSAQYPRLQWVHGSKQASGFMKTGGLFINKEQYPNFNGEGFAPTTFITRDGKEIEGFAAQSVKLAVIRIKHQWVKDETYDRNVPLAHILTVVKGCSDLLCISLRGSAKALEFQKTFNQHIGQNVALANRTRPAGAAALEPFALWFPLTAGELVSVSSKDGKSTSIVTPFEMAQPKTLDRAYVTTLWVGGDNYGQCAGYYKETAAWQKQPIWEQRNGHEEADTPAFTGGGDHITEQQLQHIVGLCEAKGLDEKELALSVTNGATNNIRAITKEEASTVIETAKAY